MELGDVALFPWAIAMDNFLGLFPWTVAFGYCPEYVREALGMEGDKG
jgi:hypothetical protein